MKGCGRLIGYKGNVDITCGKNTCQGSEIKDTKIVYCNDCKHKLGNK